MRFYQKYKALNINKSYISLEEGSETADYFCTPIGAKVIGWENGIHYCFIDGLDEMVFAVNPGGAVNENGDDLHVYALAENFEIFLKIILACSCANHVEQIIRFTKDEFERFIKNDLSDDENFRNQQQKVLNTIKNELSLTVLDNPFEYVKALQKDFDYCNIQFTNEYYDTLELERPDGTTADDIQTDYDVVGFFIRNQA